MRNNHSNFGGSEDIEALVKKAFSSMMQSKLSNDRLRDDNESVLSFASKGIEEFSDSYKENLKELFSRKEKEND